jgi:hypothetical protein
MFNIWLLRAKFPIGCKVKVVATGNSTMDYHVGKNGEVTNVDLTNEWIGVYFGNGPMWISGDSWNEFFESQLCVI